MGASAFCGAVLGIAVGLAAWTGVANRAQAGDSDMEKMIQKMQSLTEQRGYLEAHKNVQNPPGLLGGPISITVTQDEGGVFVALPDHRKLDPTIFGPPEFPRNYGGTPGITGVPVAPKFRAAAGDGFQTGPLTPFGDKHIVLPEGRLQIQAVDATAVDGATTQDKVRFSASWKDKQGNTYSVKCCAKMAAHGLEFPTFGGVVTNHIMHGFSGIGTPLMPTEFAYFAFWGFGQIEKNGEVLDKPRLIHGMLTEYVRTEGYKLAWDKDVEPKRVHFHLMVPPFQPVPEKGVFKHANVKTGFTLPNGKTLPFWHVMFENLDYQATRG